ncbi:hypothetical protein Angca_006001, partial [Angiostrongylus cantonensis]
VDSLYRMLSTGNYVVRIGGGVRVSLAAMLKYLAAEVQEIVGNDTRNKRKTRINRCHLQFAIRNDEDLKK